MLSPAARGRRLLGPRLPGAGESLARPARGSGASDLLTAHTGAERSSSSVRTLPTAAPHPSAGSAGAAAARGRVARQGSLDMELCQQFNTGTAREDRWPNYKFCPVHGPVHTVRNHALCPIHFTHTLSAATRFCTRSQPAAHQAARTHAQPATSVSVGDTTKPVGNSCS